MMRRAFVKFALWCCLFTAASGAALPVLLTGAKSPNRRQIENAFWPFQPFIAIRPRPAPAQPPGGLVLCPKFSQEDEAE